VNPTSVGNAIRFNSIHDNVGLGIDLGGDGITPNDPGDLDTGPNSLQNTPVLTAVAAGSQTRVVGRLESSPLTSFIIDLYANPRAHLSGYGDGARWLGAI